jgi:two-component system KDP operon response regulator KdpE
VDDYLTKPFVASELRARVNALLRRSHFQGSHEQPRIINYADSFLEIDLQQQVVRHTGRIVELSPKEFALLAFLIREQSRVVSHHELVREVWGEPYADAKSMVSLYIYYLRKKIMDGKNKHRYIRTHWGRGYWFAPRVEEEAEVDA